MPLLDFLQSVGLGFRGRAGGIRSSPARPTRASQYGRPTLIYPNELQYIANDVRVSPYSRSELLSGANRRLADGRYRDPVSSLYSFFTIKGNSISDYGSMYANPIYYTPLPARQPVRPTSLMSESDDDGE